MGYSFVYPVFSLFGWCNVSCYVHYPTISSDMLSSVITGKHAVHNRRFSSNKFLSWLKIIYYKLFAKTYGFFGSFSKIIMVNSKWTGNHIAEIWNKKIIQFDEISRTSKNTISIVYPPCNTLNLNQINIDNPRSLEIPIIISVAQFRPEKNHALQLRAFSKLQQMNDSHKNARLILIGGCRNSEDQIRVEELQQLANQLGIQNNVDFRLNISFSELREWFSKAVIGLHTMWCEHFGIGIVELMAASVVVIAHNSGGPKEDIVINFNNNSTGFLAETELEYANYMNYILQNYNTNEMVELRKNARKSVERFSDSNFEQAFQYNIEKLFD
eukprot:TRINITY_DN3167_c1_g1_i1.p1 TRINITY_DN3167_c1_g1~~TRINITY_DN3167_c1_g1_i1.p1  ORF type:complete len:328 (+),score=95.87 TRINITY_DN3167_c1_g1_i1:598-1581(+)